jgi:hypothetical protein
MTIWMTAPFDEKWLFSPVGLRLVDEMTGEAPLGGVEATLDILDPNGSWRETDIRNVRTPSGVVTYPGLERHGDLTGVPPRQYRVRLTADLYVPHYRAQSDGIPFTAFAWNDTNPPQQIARAAIDTLLLPAPNYPFPGHVPVLRGVVIDAAKIRVPDVSVTQSHKERAVTDCRGTFALPLRWAALDAQITIDALDQRTNRHGSIEIHLPASLYKSQTIEIT